MRGGRPARGHLLALQTGFGASGGRDERATGASLTTSGACRTCAAKTSPAGLPTALLRFAPLRHIPQQAAAAVAPAPVNVTLPGTSRAGRGRTPQRLRR